VLRLADLGRVRLLASVPVFPEYEAVVTRPEQLAAIGVSRAEMASFLDALAAMVEPVRIDYLWRPSLADPADDMVLEAAINGRAEAIVTADLRHFAPAAFGVPVMLPGDLLRRLR